MNKVCAKMMTKILRHGQTKSRACEDVLVKAQHSRVGSYVVLASYRQMLLLFTCRGRIGADVYKISECGIGRNKSVRYSQTADRKGHPILRCTGENLMEWCRDRQGDSIENATILLFLMQLKVNKKFYEISPVI